MEFIMSSKPDSLIVRVIIKPTIQSLNKYKTYCNFRQSEQFKNSRYQAGVIHITINHIIIWF